MDRITKIKETFEKRPDLGTAELEEVEALLS